jgi:hypothetical protein
MYVVGLVSDGDINSWQSVYMDADGNGTVSVADGVYMLRILAGKFRFAEVAVTSPGTLNSELVIEATIRDRAENPIDVDTDIYFEIGTSANKAMVFSEGSENAVTDSGVIVKANPVGGGSGIYRVKATSFSVFENDIGLVLVVKTRDGLGDTAIDRQVALFGSPWLKSTATFSPMTTFDIGGVCNKPEDCDDSKPCTADTCTDSKCVNADIDGCCTTEADCDDTNVCTQNVCDVNSNVCTYPADTDKNSASCDDSDETTWADVCDANGAGTCAGAACVCDPGNPGPNACQTLTDWTCNQSDGTCIYKGDPATAGTDCDDGDLTTGGDQCDDTGTCVGTACNCTTPGPCQEATGFTCTGDGTCVYLNKTFGTSCNDGNECTAGTICGQEAEAGTCILDPQNPLVKSGETCDDDDPETYDDRCSGTGECVGKTCTCTDPAPCEKTDGFTCDDNGTCIYVSKAEDDSCDNSEACSHTDTCVTNSGTGKLECVGIEYSCSDTTATDGQGNNIFVGTCDPAVAGACVYDKNCTGVVTTIEGVGYATVCSKLPHCFAASVSAAVKGICDGNGACSFPAQADADGDSRYDQCDDGDDCTFGDTCVDNDECAGSIYTCTDLTCASGSCDPTTSCAQTSGTGPDKKAETCTEIPGCYTDTGATCNADRSASLLEEACAYNPGVKKWVNCTHTCDYPTDCTSPGLCEKDAGFSCTSNTCDYVQDDEGATCDTTGTCDAAGNCVGGAGSCDAGKSDCGGTCVDMQIDATHCGECDKLCVSPTGTCTAGVCSCPTDGDKVCNGACIDVQSDQFNCGDCGETCDGAKDTCTQGVCTCKTATDSVCQDTCIDLQTNTTHCGECDKTCTGATNTCVAGVCSCPLSNQKLCNGACVDVQSNAANCGECGEVCVSPAGTCTAGVCSCPTATDKVCDGACVDVQSNDDACGDCTTQCTSPLTCSSGACGCATSGQKLCDGACVDVQSNDDACGDCTTKCTSPETCSAGVCGCPNTGEKLCNGSCIDVQANDNACGDCTTKCTSPETCSAGVCGCGTGEKLCNGSCVDVLANDSACGDCNVTCTTPETCSAGVCSCPNAGEKLCNGSCVDVQSDASNCGTCAKVCSGITDACTAGVCSCPTAGDEVCFGACVDKKTDNDNCGTCGDKCTSPNTCNDSVCGCATSGEVVCDGTCVDILTDAGHCGDCTTTCTAPAGTCAAGACGCPTAGQTSCGTYCADLTADATNCGACSFICDQPKSSCNTGSCGCAPATPDYCAGDNLCVDFSKDASYCGDCATECVSPESACTSGACSCPVSGQTACDDGTENICVDTTKNASHCGTCNTACVAPQSLCSSGTCSCPSTGDTVCGTGDEKTCYNLQTNVNNCGTCGQVCEAPTTKCASGACGCPSATDTVCGTGTNKACVDTSQDTSNCGTCGKKCEAPTTKCSSGACACPLTGHLPCGPQGSQTCIDVQSDNNNCGACGNVCGAGNTCTDGICVGEGCTGNTTICEGECVDTQTDASNCGSCGGTCSTPKDACTAGGCTCPTSTDLVCGPEANKKCFNADTSAVHCGACDKACNSPKICGDGACACPTATPTYCSDTNKCVDKTSDLAHCGACDTACPVDGMSCTNADCTCPAATPSHCSDLDPQICANLDDDADNCGTCGSVCPSSKATCCSKACKDLESDDTNCGSCGNECSTGDVCHGSTCCTPQCKDVDGNDFICGDDGCGGVCGSCATGKKCATDRFRCIVDCSDETTNATGTACDDENAKTFNEVCSVNATCVGLSCACAGLNHADCQESDGWTCDQLVSPAASFTVANCHFVSKNDGGTCEDGKQCTSGTTCSSGSCTGGAIEENKACDDTENCTSSDKCSAAGVCAGTTYACTDLTLPECHTVTDATCDENRTNGVEDTDNEGTTIYTCTFPSDWTKKGTSCNDSDDCSYADKCGCVGGGTACAEASPGQGLECGGTDYSCLEGETGFVGNCTLDGSGDCTLASSCGGTETISNRLYATECTQLPVCFTSNYTQGAATLKGLCDGTGTCKFPLPPNADNNKDAKSDPCDDGSSCTHGDTCNANTGLCVGKPYVCNDIGDANWKSDCSTGDCDSTTLCATGGTVDVGGNQVEYAQNCTKLPYCYTAKDTDISGNTVAEGQCNLNRTSGVETGCTYTVGVGWQCDNTCDFPVFTQQLNVTCDDAVDCTHTDKCNIPSGKATYTCAGTPYSCSDTADGAFVGTCDPTADSDSDGTYDDCNPEALCLDSSGNATAPVIKTIDNASVYFSQRCTKLPMCHSAKVDAAVHGLCDGLGTCDFPVVSDADNNGADECDDTDSCTYGDVCQTNGRCNAPTANIYVCNDATDPNYLGTCDPAAENADCTTGNVCSGTTVDGATAAKAAFAISCTEVPTCYTSKEPNGAEGRCNRDRKADHTQKKDGDDNYTFTCDFPSSQSAIGNVCNDSDLCSYDDQCQVLFGKKSEAGCTGFPYSCDDPTAKDPGGNNIFVGACTINYNDPSKCTLGTLCDIVTSGAKTYNEDGDGTPDFSLIKDESVIVGSSTTPFAEYCSQVPPCFTHKITNALKGVCTGEMNANGSPTCHFPIQLDDPADSDTHPDLCDDASHCTHADFCRMPVDNAAGPNGVCRGTTYTCVPSDAYFKSNTEGDDPNYGDPSAAAGYPNQYQSDGDGFHCVPPNDPDPTSTQKDKASGDFDPDCVRAEHCSTATGKLTVNPTTEVTFATKCKEAPQCYSPIPTSATSTGTTCSTDANCTGGEICVANECRSVITGDENYTNNDGGTRLQASCNMDRASGNEDCTWDDATSEWVCGYTCDFPTNPDATGEGCKDDNLCTYDDTCVETGGVVDCKGTEYNCGTKNAYNTCDPMAPPTGKNSCNRADVCTTDTPVKLTYDTQGTKDHNFATGCRYIPQCHAASVTVGSDTITGRCNGDGTCEYPQLPADSACDDGNPCTFGDSCTAAGKCAGTTYSCTPTLTGGQPAADDATYMVIPLDTTGTNNHSFDCDPMEKDSNGNYIPCTRTDVCSGQSTETVSSCDPNNGADCKDNTVIWSTGCTKKPQCHGFATVDTYSHGVTVGVARCGLDRYATGANKGAEKLTNGAPTCEFPGVIPDIGASCNDSNNCSHADACGTDYKCAGTTYQCTDKTAQKFIGECDAMVAVPNCADSTLCDAAGRCTALPVCYEADNNSACHVDRVTGSDNPAACVTSSTCAADEMCRKGKCVPTNYGEELAANTCTFPTTSSLGSHCNDANNCSHTDQCGDGANAGKCLATPYICNTLGLDPNKASDQALIDTYNEDVVCDPTNPAHNNCDAATLCTGTQSSYSNIDYDQDGNPDSGVKLHISRDCERKPSCHTNKATHVDGLTPFDTGAGDSIVTCSVNRDGNGDETYGGNTASHTCDFPVQPVTTKNLFCNDASSCSHADVCSEKGLCNGTWYNPGAKKGAGTGTSPTTAKSHDTCSASDQDGAYEGGEDLGIGCTVTDVCKSHGTITNSGGSSVTGGAECWFMPQCADSSTAVCNNNNDTSGTVTDADGKPGEFAACTQADIGADTANCKSDGLGALKLSGETPLPCDQDASGHLDNGEACYHTASYPAAGAGQPCGEDTDCDACDPDTGCDSANCVPTFNKQCWKQDLCGSGADAGKCLDKGYRAFKTHCGAGDEVCSNQDYCGQGTDEGVCLKNHHAEQTLCGIQVASVGSVLSKETCQDSVSGQHCNDDESTCLSDNGTTHRSVDGGTTSCKAQAEGQSHCVYQDKCGGGDDAGTCVDGYEAAHDLIEIAGALDAGTDAPTATPYWPEAATCADKYSADTTVVAAAHGTHTDQCIKSGGSAGAYLCKGTTYTCDATEFKCIDGQDCGSSSKYDANNANVLVDMKFADGEKEVIQVCVNDPITPDTDHCWVQPDCNNKDDANTMSPDDNHNGVEIKRTNGGGTNTWKDERLFPANLKSKATATGLHPKAGKTYHTCTFTVDPTTAGDQCKVGIPGSGDRACSNQDLCGDDANLGVCMLNDHNNDLPCGYNANSLSPQAVQHCQHGIPPEQQGAGGPYRYDGSLSGAKETTNNAGNKYCQAQEGDDCIPQDTCQTGVCVDGGLGGTAYMPKDWACDDKDHSGFWFEDCTHTNKCNENGWCTGIKYMCGGSFVRNASADGEPWLIHEGGHSLWACKWDEAKNSADWVMESSPQDLSIDKCLNSGSYMGAETDVGVSGCLANWVGPWGEGSNTEHSGCTWVTSSDKTTFSLYCGEEAENSDQWLAKCTKATSTATTSYATRNNNFDASCIVNANYDGYFAGLLADPAQYDPNTAVLSNAWPPHNAEGERIYFSATCNGNGGCAEYPANVVVDDEGEIEPTFCDDDVASSYGDQCQLDASCAGTDYLCEELTRPSSYNKQDYTDKSVGETAGNCPTDCGTLCGDGVCNGTEHDSGASNYCEADCGKTVADAGFQCGDGIPTESHENTVTCPKDYGSSCGDGACNGNETSDSTAGSNFCNEDCGHDYNTSYCGDTDCDGYEPSSGMAICSNAHDGFCTDISDEAHAQVAKTDTQGDPYEEHTGGGFAGYCDTGLYKYSGPTAYLKVDSCEPGHHDQCLPDADGVPGKCLPECEARSTLGGNSDFSGNCLAVPECHSNPTAGQNPCYYGKEGYTAACTTSYPVSNSSGSLVPAPKWHPAVVRHTSLGLCASCATPSSCAYTNTAQSALSGTVKDRPCFAVGTPIPPVPFPNVDRTNEIAGPGAGTGEETSMFACDTAANIPCSGSSGPNHCPGIDGSCDDYGLGVLRHTCSFPSDAAAAGTACGVGLTGRADRICSRQDVCGGGDTGGDAGECYSNHDSQETRCGTKAGLACQGGGCATQSEGDGHCISKDYCNAGVCRDGGTPSFDMPNVDVDGDNTNDTEQVGSHYWPVNTACDDGNNCTFNDRCNATGTCAGTGYACSDIAETASGTEGRTVVTADHQDESLIVHTTSGVCDAARTAPSDNTFDGTYRGCNFAPDCFSAADNACDDNRIGLGVEYDTAAWNDENRAGSYPTIQNDTTYLKTCTYTADGSDAGNLCGKGLKEYNNGTESTNSSDYRVCSEHDMCGSGGDAGRCLQNHHGSTVQCGNSPHARPWGATNITCQNKDAGANYYRKDYDGTKDSTSVCTVQSDGARQCIKQDLCDGGGACIDNQYENEFSTCGDTDDVCSDQDTCGASTHTGAYEGNDVQPGNRYTGKAGTTDTTEGLCMRRHHKLDTFCGDHPPNENQIRAEQNCQQLGSSWLLQDTSTKQSSVELRGIASGSCGAQNDGATGCIKQDKCDGVGVCDDKKFESEYVLCGSAADEICSDQDSCGGVSTDVTGHYSGGQHVEKNTTLDNTAINGTDSGLCLSRHHKVDTACGNDNHDYSDAPNAACQLPTGATRADGTVLSAATSPASVANTFSSCRGTCSDSAVTQCQAQTDADLSKDGWGWTKESCVKQDVCTGSGGGASACTDKEFKTTATACYRPDEVCSGEDFCFGDTATSAETGPDKCNYKHHLPDTFCYTATNDKWTRSVDTKAATCANCLGDDCITDDCKAQCTTCESGSPPEVWDTLTTLPTTATNKTCQEWDNDNVYLQTGTKTDIAGLAASTNCYDDVANDAAYPECEKQDVCDGSGLGAGRCNSFTGSAGLSPTTTACDPRKQPASRGYFGEVCVKASTSTCLGGDCKAGPTINCNTPPGVTAIDDQCYDAKGYCVQTDASADEGAGWATGACQYFPKPVTTACGSQTIESCSLGDWCQTKPSGIMYCDPRHQSTDTNCSSSTHSGAVDCWVLNGTSYGTGLVAGTCPAQQVCEKQDKCSGNAASCTDKGFKGTSTECRASTGSCDPVENCTGTAPGCPTCNASDADCCKSSDSGCINGFHKTTKTCYAGTTTGTDGDADLVVDNQVCDPPRVCTGTNKDCPVVATTDLQIKEQVCRSAVNSCDTSNDPNCTTCDLAEKCVIVDATRRCADDIWATSASQTVCRISLDTVSVDGNGALANTCDPVELCTGTSKACPADTKTAALTTCNDNKNTTHTDGCGGTEASPSGLCVGTTYDCDDANSPYPGRPGCASSGTENGLAPPNLTTSTTPWDAGCDWTYMTNGAACGDQSETVCSRPNQCRAKLGTESAPDMVCDPKDASSSTPCLSNGSQACWQVGSGDDVVCVGMDTNGDQGESQQDGKIYGLCTTEAVTELIVCPTAPASNACHKQDYCGAEEFAGTCKDAGYRPASDNYVCEATGGDCQPERQCDGTGVSCPLCAAGATCTTNTSFLAEGTVCHSTAGGNDTKCDPGRSCAGDNKDCPAAMTEAEVLATLCADAGTTVLCDAGKTCKTDLTCGLQAYTANCHPNEICEGSPGDANDEHCGNYGGGGQDCECPAGMPACYASTGVPPNIDSSAPWKYDPNTKCGINCIPTCSGKCGGDDGCFGTCPNNCAVGYQCISNTCVSTTGADCCTVHSGSEGVTCQGTTLPSGTWKTTLNCMACVQEMEMEDTGFASPACGNTKWDEACAGYATTYDNANICGGATEYCYNGCNDECFCGETCDAKTCGVDGNGTSCGTCTGGQVCVSDQCVESDCCSTNNTAGCNNNACEDCVAAYQVQECILDNQGATIQCTINGTTTECVSNGVDGNATCESSCDEENTSGTWTADCVTLTNTTTAPFGSCTFGGTDYGCEDGCKDECSCAGNCDSKNCGDDGLGGTCGTCVAGFETCNGQGYCDMIVPGCCNNVGVNCADSTCTQCVGSLFEAKCIDEGGSDEECVDAANTCNTTFTPACFDMANQGDGTTDCVTECGCTGASGCEPKTADYYVTGLGVTCFSSTLTYPDGCGNSVAVPSGLCSGQECANAANDGIDTGDVVAGQCVPGGGLHNTPTIVDTSCSPPFRSFNTNPNTGPGASVFADNACPASATPDNYCCPKQGGTCTSTIDCTYLDESGNTCPGTGCVGQQGCGGDESTGLWIEDCELCVCFGQNAAGAYSGKPQCCNTGWSEECAYYAKNNCGEHCNCLE